MPKTPVWEGFAGVFLKISLTLQVKFCLPAD